MRGVSFTKAKNTWKATYKNKDKNISMEKRFSTKEQAESQRKEWEKRFGMPNAHKDRFCLQKDYSNFENEHFKILGSTGETDNNGRQKVLTLNKYTGGYETHLAVSITSGQLTGIPLVDSHRDKNARHYGYNKRRKKYYFRISLKGIRYSKSGFKTEDEAIAYRNKFLKEHNLPIPD